MTLSSTRNSKKERTEFQHLKSALPITAPVHILCVFDILKQKF